MWPELGALGSNVVPLKRAQVMSTTAYSRLNKVHLTYHIENLDVAYQPSLPSICLLKTKNLLPFRFMFGRNEGESHPIRPPSTGDTETLPLQRKKRGYTILHWSWSAYKAPNQSVHPFFFFFPPLRSPVVNISGREVCLSDIIR